MLTTRNAARLRGFWRDEQVICFYFLSWEEPPAPDKARLRFLPLTGSLKPPGLTSDLPRIANGRKLR